MNLPRSLVIAFTTAAVAGLGCRTRHADPCLAEIQHIEECTQDPFWTSGVYNDYVQQCRSDPQAECEAECMAIASCDDIEQGLHSGSPADSIMNCMMEECGSDPCCDTPLVLSLDSAAVRFTTSDRQFDLGGAASAVTDWPSAATPWIGLDHNGNGAIDDGGELFGSGWTLATGDRAANGFIAMRTLDSNGDGQITPNDDAWPQILVWSDRDADRLSSPGELAALSDFGVVSIDLAYGLAPRCDLRGNCEVERAAAHYLDAGGDLHEGSVVDVHLRRLRR